MSDSDFVDVGDELVVRIGGYPVGKAKVWKITSENVHAIMNDELDHPTYFLLPLDFKDYDVTDGVAHEESPVTYSTDGKPHKARRIVPPEPVDTPCSCLGHSTPGVMHMVPCCNVPHVSEPVEKEDCWCHIYDEDVRPCSNCRMKAMGM